MLVRGRTNRSARHRAPKDIGSGRHGKHVVVAPSLLPERRRPQPPGRLGSASGRRPRRRCSTPGAAFYRFKLGSIEATVVSDGPLSIGDPKRTFRGPTPKELGKMMSDHFLPTDNVVLDQNVLVINTGDKLALFETGMSSVKRTDAMGRLTANLKQAGIDPKDIDAVIPTHAHIDHVGGSWPRTAAATSPTRRSTSPSPTSNSGPTTSDSAPRRKALARTAQQEPAAQSRPHRVLQGRPGRHSRRTGDAHAGPHGRTHQLRDQLGRQVAAPDRRPHAPRHPDREAADGGRLRHRSQAGRGRRASR